MAHNTEVASIDDAISICPKHMRNGPCGGVRPGGMCEADATLPCPYLCLDDRLPWRLHGPLEALGHTRNAQGKLVNRLRSGHFVVITEAYPPDGVDTSTLIARYSALGRRIDAVNVPDNPLATPHLSALATAALLQTRGVSTILNMSCRDRNRISLQSDLLATSALGIENIFCVTGDHPALGDHSYARAVFELDSMGLLAIARRLRDEGAFENGQPLQSAPTYLIGAVGKPYSPPMEWQAERTAAKVAAGADFIQAHPVCDLEVLRSFVQRLADLNTLDRAWLIAGVVVATTLEQALWLQTEMPVPLVPDDFITLLHQTKAETRRAEAVAYTADLIAELRQIPGISGVLLFPLGEDVEAVGEVIDKAGLTQSA